MLKKYRGSCHCGRVTFECEIDLSEGIRKCNCSFCWKTRYLKAFAYQEHFRLLKGGEQLGDYQASSSSWPEGHVHHYFCRHCGVRGFSRGYLEMEPFNGEFHAVNVACLDDATPDEIAAAPVIFEDGINDRQDRAPEFSAHL